MLRHAPAFLLLGMLSLLCPSCAHVQEGVGTTPSHETPFSVVAIGDAGEANSELRANSTLLTNMYSGQHDGGSFDAMIFLGDNFYDTGLNIPADEVEDEVKQILGPYKITFEALGRQNIHALPGNHDYYARNAIEASILFGLISIAEAPVGLSGRGNARETAIEGWTYHDVMPGTATYPLFKGSPDSVQFVFLDSALPLRTDTTSWAPALDSLRRLLDASRAQRGIIWRILCMHHPIYSLGEHGGYSVWNDETNRVDYLTPCNKDSNAVGWVKNWFDPEDLCAEKYGRFMETLKSVIAASGVRIQVALTGHDHSLQLLSYPERDSWCAGCPKLHIVSGAGSRPTMVRFPSPPEEYTSAPSAPSKRGVSPPGFARLTFTRDRLRVVFFNAFSIAPLDMGGGRREFVISPDGSLLPEAKGEKDGSQGLE